MNEPRKPILNLDEVSFEPWGHGERYAAQLGRIGPKIGAKKLGYNLTVLPPGKRAFPAHNHHVNEEMFYVIEGSGSLRVGTREYPIRAGDVIACPPGGQDSAHQIVNTSADEELRYLSVSTMMYPEFVEYPNSKKFGVRVELGPNAQGETQWFRFLGRSEQCLEYWDGE